MNAKKMARHVRLLAIGAAMERAGIGHPLQADRLRMAMERDPEVRAWIMAVGGPAPDGDDPDPLAVELV